MRALLPPSRTAMAAFDIVIIPGAGNGGMRDRLHGSCPIEPAMRNAIRLRRLSAYQHG